MNDGCAVVGIIVGMIILFLLGYLNGAIHGYEDGQIDAMTGKVYYCLEKQDNSEFIWMYYSDGCKLGEANSVERKD